MSTIVALTQAVLETIETEPLGAPAGPLYLALQHIQMDLSTFSLYMASLERLSLITKRAHCYHITPTGREFIRSHSSPRNSATV